MVERVNQLGIPVELDAVLEKAGTGTVGRPHLARVMIDLAQFLIFPMRLICIWGRGNLPDVPRPP